MLVHDTLTNSEKSSKILFKTKDATFTGGREGYFKTYGLKEGKIYRLRN